MGAKRVKGNGVNGTQQRQVSQFAGIEVKGGIDVILMQSSANEVRIEGDENLLAYIEIENKGDVLEISTKQGYSLKPKKGLKVYASAPVFNKIYVLGSGDIKSETKLTNASSVEAKISGSGDIDLNVDAPEISAKISGSGTIIINGATRNFDASIAGSGDIKCYNLLSEKSNVDIAGSGDVEVYASKQLSVDIKGAGDVHYKGSPSINQSIKGSGSVSKEG